MKVLISAYACEPNQGSEPGVGWNWSLQAAKNGHQIHVITRTNNKKTIENENLNNFDITFHYVDYSNFICKMKKKFGNYGTIIYYYFWQLLVYQKAKKLDSKYKFELLHHITFVTDWMPSGLSLLKTPFLWGPIGGYSHKIPAGILYSLPLSAIIAEYLRRFMQSFFYYLDPFLSKTRENANKILFYTNESMEVTSSKWKEKSRSIIHIGINKNELALKHASDSQNYFDNKEFKILSNGRLVSWKGYDLLILGFSEFLKKTNQSSQLLITGNGQYKNYLQRLIESYKLQSNIKILRRLPARQDVLHTIFQCDLYALLTFRDGPPVGILEAMGVGKPILCLGYGATGELVPNEGGIKIFSKKFEDIKIETSEKLLWASENKSKLIEMGRFNKEYVEKKHDWNRIGQNIDKIYRQVIS